MSKKAVEIAELAGEVVTISQITCSKCRKMDEVDISPEIDILDGLDYFYEEGWRNIKSKIYCKNCIK